jgi:hypothetical protein
MDPFHERLARVALDAAGSFGFALAGGYAVQAHGFLNRMSADVDLFAEASAESDITQAVDVVIAAYLREGLQVETELRSASFARLELRSATESAKVELGLDWRKNEPVRLAVGPVLHPDDAVANKVCALSWFAEALAAIDRLPDNLFQPYGMSPKETAALRERMRAWARRINAAE